MNTQTKNNILNENFEFYTVTKNNINKTTKNQTISFNENFEDLDKDFNQKDLIFQNDAGRLFVKKLDEISKKYNLK